MTHKVIFVRAAAREIAKLDQTVQKRVLKATEKLEDDPRPRGVEKLSENPRFYRLKVGEHRVIYTVDDDKNTVIIVLVRNRRDAYRNLDALDQRLLADAILPILVAKNR